MLKTIVPDLLLNIPKHNNHIHFRIEGARVYFQKNYYFIIEPDEYMGGNIHVRKYNLINRSGLFIAAPKEEFDLTGLKEKGLGFFPSKKVEIKDPVVFRYVRGGVQVLSKWGPEAMDPALQVDILN